MLLGIDVGTTHCKAGLFSEDGTQIASTSMASPINYNENGYPYYEPDALWQVVRRTIEQVTQARNLREIVAVGVASMAETGLLVDCASGRPRTHLVPWYSKQAEPGARLLDQLVAHPIERFTLTGIRPNYKCALAKLLWLKERDANLLRNAVWLSTADYIVYRLTGAFVTDYSLAGRTYAFRIDRNAWDVDWLEEIGIPREVFPSAQPAGTSFPAVADCLAPGTPVAVAGHDHVCAAFATSAISPQAILDSMGTAETLVGTWTGEIPDERAFESGLLFGRHVVPDAYYWMGSLSASGGSIEWLRAIINDPPMTYDEIDRLLESVPEPTGILYFPYLAGSSTNSNAQASFIGLKQSHNRAHLLKAVVEGTAIEIEHIRGMVESILELTTERVIAVGGGTRSPVWMQVKADVSGCVYHIYPLLDTTMLGAAMVAGLGAQVYESAEAAVQAVKRHDMKVVRPRLENHITYRRLYTNGYLKLMQPLKEHYATLSSEIIS